jgi:hypothetical protein
MGLVARRVGHGQLLTCINHLGRDTLAQAAMPQVTSTTRLFLLLMFFS